MTRHLHRMRRRHGAPCKTRAQVMCRRSQREPAHRPWASHPFPSLPTSPCFSAMSDSSWSPNIVWSKDKTGGAWGAGNTQRPIFGSYPYPPNFLFTNLHEHILVFAKPDNVRRRGSTVLPYRFLMELDP